jgi:hypothetical protein
MGFRDLLAMLAMQVWRLIAEPDSLCAQVLRAKYYPFGDILSVGRKSNCSFTWQSLVAGIKTFKRGHIWRVSNGDSINIWKDPWIPSCPDRKVLTPRGGAVYTKVSEIINPITGQWDRQLISSFVFST